MVTGGEELFPLNFMLLIYIIYHLTSLKYKI